ncbi:MAG: hypothetical protein WC254_06960 [Candidatus Woesearchaeota archaeon]|jgi:hypothetical protein
MGAIHRQATPLPFTDVVTVTGTVVKRNTGIYHPQYPLAIEYGLDNVISQEVFVGINSGEDPTTIDSYVGQRAELDIATLRNPISPEKTGAKRAIRIYLGGKLIYDMFPGLQYDSLDQRTV